MSTLDPNAARQTRVTGTADAGLSIAPIGAKFICSRVGRTCFLRLEFSGPNYNGPIDVTTQNIQWPNILPAWMAPSRLEFTDADQTYGICTIGVNGKRYVCTCAVDDTSFILFPLVPDTTAGELGILPGQPDWPSPSEMYVNTGYLVYLGADLDSI